MTDSLPTIEYTLSFEDGPAADWQVLSFSCAEELNGGCQMSLHIATELLEAELEEFLGASCELIVARGEQLRFFYGVVGRVDLLGHQDHHVVISVQTRSAFELSKQRQRSKIWQEATVSDIVDEVLSESFADFGRTSRPDHAQRGSSPRVYCVQYRETNYDYVKRLLEEEGINYYLLHDADAGHEVMVTADENDQFPDAENLDGGPEFPVITTNPALAVVESIQSFEWIQRLTTTAVLRRDFDWNTPTDLLTEESPGEDARGYQRQIHAHGRRRFETDDLLDRAADLGDSLRMDGNTARGSSNSAALRPGFRFSTDAHHAEGAPHEFIVTRVFHRGGGSSLGDLGHAGPDVSYANEFECVVSDAVIRPRQTTPKPRTHGPQTATVVGDEEIHTDEFGRIQVQFHWEEPPGFATGASCWMRVAQSWAQGGWGAQFIPRVGMEVVVEFLEGNPDRPLVTGCVYNGNHEPPFPLPANSTQSGWRTNSSPGGGGSNELRFEDAAGNEEIYMHGQKNWTVEINHDTAKSTGNDETHSVGHDRSKDVGNDQSESIGNDKSISVGNNHTESIGNDMALTVGNNQTVSVGTDQSITIGSSMTESVGKSCKQTVMLQKGLKVGGRYTILVGGQYSATIGGMSGEKVGGMKSVTVGASSKHTVIGSYKCKAKSITEEAKTDISMAAKGDIKGKGDKNVTLESGGPFTGKAKTKMTFDAGDEFRIKCGSSMIKMKKDGTIVIKGKKITVKGSDKITLKGGKINEN